MFSWILRQKNDHTDPGLVQQQAELQHLQSGSPLHQQLLAELVQLVGPAVLHQVEAASPAAAAVDTVGTDHRAAACAEVVVAGKEAEGAELRDGRGERSEREQRELKPKEKLMKTKSSLVCFYKLRLIRQQCKYLTWSEEGTGCL